MATNMAGGPGAPTGQWSGANSGPTYPTGFAGMQTPKANMNRKFNLRLLIACLVGGCIGFVAGTIFLSCTESLSGIPRFGVFMALLALGVFGGACTSCGRYKVSLLSGILKALAGVAAVLLAAMLLEFIYELNISAFTPEQPPTVEVSLTDYIFAIDDSGSMAGNDPNSDRYSAFQTLIDNLDPSSRVGLLRFSDQVDSGHTVAPDLLTEDQIKTLKRESNSSWFQGGGTNFESVLNEAWDLFNHLDVTGRAPVVVLLSDGEAYLDMDAMTSKYNEKGYTICTIYLGSGSEIPEVLQQLAGGTGGIAVTVDDSAKLLDAFNHLVTVTNNQATLDNTYTRFLLYPRNEYDQGNILALVERIVFFTLLGLLFAAVLLLMLGGDLQRQLIIQTAAGLLVGILLEAGYALSLGTWLCGSVVLLSIVAAYFVSWQYTAPAGGSQYIPNWDPQNMQSLQRGGGSFDPNAINKNGQFPGGTGILNRGGQGGGPKGTPGGSPGGPGSWPTPKR